MQIKGVVTHYSAKKYGCNFTKEESAGQFTLRMKHHNNEILFFKICKHNGGNELLIWLYRKEPMDKENTFNAILTFRNSGNNGMIIELHNRGFLQLLEPVIQYENIQHCTNTICQEVNTMLES